jgi:hypothetical protein
MQNYSPTHCVERFIQAEMILPSARHKMTTDVIAVVYRSITLTSSKIVVFNAETGTQLVSFHTENIVELSPYEFFDFWFNQQNTTPGDYTVSHSSDQRYVSNDVSSYTIWYTGVSYAVTNDNTESLRVFLHRDELDAWLFANHLPFDFYDFAE